MNLDRHNSESIHQEQSGEDLHALLAAAEQRRDKELAHNGKIASIIIGVPTALVVLWVAGFLIHFKLTEKAPEPEPLGSGSLTDSPLFKNAMRSLETPQLDIDGVNKKSASDSHPSNGFVKKEDIEFAEKMMNFGETPNAKR